MTLWALLECNGRLPSGLEINPLTSGVSCVIPIPRTSPRVSKKIIERSSYGPRRSSHVNLQMQVKTFYFCFPSSERLREKADRSCDYPIDPWSMTRGDISRLKSMQKSKALKSSSRTGDLNKKNAEFYDSTEYALYPIHLSESSLTPAYSIHLSVDIATRFVYDKTLHPTIDSSEWIFSRTHPMRKQLKRIGRAEITFYPRELSTMAHVLRRSPVLDLKKPMTILGHFEYSLLLCRTKTVPNKRIKKMTSPTRVMFHPMLSARRKEEIFLQFLVVHRGTGKMFPQVKDIKTKCGKARRTDFSLPFVIQAANQYKFSMIEADIHLTKDGVPVVHHDFTLPVYSTNPVLKCDDPIFVPIAHMTFEQIRKLHRKRTIISSHECLLLKHGKKLFQASMALKTLNLTNSSPAMDRINGQKRCLTALFPSDVQKREKKRQCLTSSKDESLREKIRKFKRSPIASALPFKSKKGNSLEGIPTYAALLESTPPALGLNVEIKYPTFANEICFSPAPPYHIMDTYVSRILETTKKFAHRRQIVFSSFEPDICLLARMKQKVYPVLLLIVEENRSVEETLNDGRVLTIERALEFSQKAHLDGIILDARWIKKYPTLVGKTKHFEKKIWTYGLLNNQASFVRYQYKLGVDRVISDFTKEIQRLVKPERR